MLFLFTFQKLVIVLKFFFFCTPKSKVFSFAKLIIYFDISLLLVKAKILYSIEFS